MKITFYILTFLLIVSCSNEPKNYNDCILRYVKEDMNQIATREIVRSCRSKFKNSKDQLLKEMPSEAVGKLTGKLGISGNYLSGNVYNGNENWIIREVIVELRDKPEGRNLFDDSDKIKREKYRFTIHIYPLKNKDFFENTNWPESTPLAWRIVSAKGELSE